MARSISIDHLGFPNLKRGSDSIIVKYNESKNDKAGEKCSNKNINANPTDPSMCFFTALGIYCCHKLLSLALGTASHRFFDKLQKLVDNYADVVDGYVHSSRTNPHEIRKGATSFSTSGASVPPSLISVALRREWSMGKVFDVYFNFGKFGDNCLRRILAGLDPNVVSFGDLPPYFEKDMDDKIIEKV